MRKRKLENTILMRPWCGCLPSLQPTEPLYPPFMSHRFYHERNKYMPTINVYCCLLSNCFFIMMPSFFFRGGAPAIVVVFREILHLMAVSLSSLLSLSVFQFNSKSAVIGRPQEQGGDTHKNKYNNLKNWKPWMPGSRMGNKALVQTMKSIFQSVIIRNWKQRIFLCLLFSSSSWHFALESF